jgi:hypothetical protein
MKKSMFIQTNSRVVELMPSNEAFKELNQNYVDIFNVPTLATNEEIKIIMHFYKKKIHRDPNLQEDIFI